MRKMIHCDKWIVVRIQLPDILREAELDELECGIEEAQEETEEEKLHRSLDSSKFQALWNKSEQ